MTDPASIAEPVVRLREVFCVHRTNEGDAAALQGTNLDLGDGELLCVLGPSGAGKSTLLRVIAGIQQPSAGVVQVLGRDIGREPSRRRARLRHERIGFLGQHADAALPPDLSAARAVELPLALRGVGSGQPARAGGGAAARGRSGRSRRGATRRAVGRRAPADRAVRGAGPPPLAAAGRRADRRARRRQRRGGADADLRAGATPRHQRGAGIPRRGHGRDRRSLGPDPRWPRGRGPAGRRDRAGRRAWRLVAVARGAARRGRDRRARSCRGAQRRGDADRGGRSAPA